ncbi:MAG TPA: hypothetical protein VLB51_17295 [Methylomirabilota bacterium]|nr:hypothetical protein [Methylomirabilota bacterium]
MFCPNNDCPDFVASGLRAEYRDDISVCPYCGTPLVAERPADTAPAEGEAGSRPGPWIADDEELEPVIEATDPTEVPIIRGMLDAAGIPYLTRGEDALTAFPGTFAGASIFNPRARGVVFVVPSRMADEARALLDELEEGVVEPDEAW